MAEEDLPYNPMELVSTDSTSDAPYTYVNVKAPIMAGLILKCFVWSLETRLAGALLLQHLKNANLITQVFVKSRYHEPPMHTPHYSTKYQEEVATLQLDPGASPCARLTTALDCLSISSSTGDRKEGATQSFRRWTIRDYSKAYMTGEITPTMVAERFLRACEESLQPKPGMGFFINCFKEDVLKQAEASAARYKKGEPLSILDGVPIAVKDEIDCLPYPTTGGSKWLHKARKVKDDAACVRHLRECGALLVGKTNMHELGAGTTGINPHYGATRNPYNKSRYSGGSSGGSAASVAAGMCPAALGVDGGGSVRMPSALCGVVGFKGTFGRVSSYGVLPFNWTVGMVGIHAATVEDALIMYTVIHGHLPGDHIVSIPPPTNLPLLRELGQPQGDSPISNISFAKYTKWFEDCDPPILEACLKALDILQQRYKCKVVEVTLPEIEEMRLGHYITIGCECYTSLGLDYSKWLQMSCVQAVKILEVRNLGFLMCVCKYLCRGKADSGMDTRAAFAIYSCFNNIEFLAAQRLRYRQMHYHMKVFEKADIIVTPTTGCTAKPINESALKVGELNYVDGAKLVRFQIAGNFLGLPAITVPVGYDAEGLPIGIQLLGRPWSEATLLRAACTIENFCMPHAKRPEVFYDLLS